MISVIMPIYNGSKYIKRAIESVLNQSYKNFELILVNDGSTDNTEAIINSFKNKKIRTFTQKNKGPSSARNLGIKNSKGAYITFLDQDDFYHPKKLYFQLNYLKKKEKDGGKYICYCDAETHDLVKGNIFTESKCTAHPEDNVYAHLYMVHFIRTPGLVLYNRKVFEEIGLFNVRYRYAHDYEFHLRVSKKYKWCFLNKPLLSYFLHGENDVLNVDKVENEILRIVKKEEKINQKLINDNLRNIKRFNIFAHLIEYYLEKNNYIKVRLYLLKNYSLKPDYEQLICTLRILILIKEYKLVISLAKKEEGKFIYDYKLDFYKANAFYLTKDYVKAEKCYHLALELCKNTPEVINNLGCIYSIQNNYEKAKKYFNEAIYLKADLFTAMKNKKNFDKSEKVKLIETHLRRAVIK